MNMTPDQILDAAADALESMGHTKKELLAESGEMCALGAINYATHGRALPTATEVAGESFYTTTQLRAMSALVNELPAPKIPYYSALKDVDITRWNDDEKTTPTEVIDTLRFAAKRFRNG